MNAMSLCRGSREHGTVQFASLFIANIIHCQCHPERISNGNYIICVKYDVVIAVIGIDFSQMAKQFDNFLDVLVNF